MFSPKNETAGASARAERAIALVPKKSFLIIFSISVSYLDLTWLVFVLHDFYASIILKVYGFGKDFIEFSD